MADSNSQNIDFIQVTNYTSIEQAHIYQDIINNISVISNKHITLISVIFQHQIYNHIYKLSFLAITPATKIWICSQLGQWVKAPTIFMNNVTHDETWHSSDHVIAIWSWDRGLYFRRIFMFLHVSCQGKKITQNTTNQVTISQSLTLSRTALVNWGAAATL